MRVPLAHWLMVYIMYLWEYTPWYVYTAQARSQTFQKGGVDFSVPAVGPPLV